ncbi:MAG: aminoglycoside phosphotransferase, partial [Kangiellaceae bacterium]|nr:aminoglycoside phosphotransferase [Kangiellaceae bacterium]
MHDPRKDNLSQWVAQQMNIDSPQLIAVSGDASFRRYFRFECSDQSFIAVDAPPEHENNQAFASIAKLLESHHLVVPQFLHIDLEQGYIIISDLGDKLLLAELTAKNADSYYSHAFDILLNMQSIPVTKEGGLLNYDNKKLNFELSLFKD